MEAQSVQTATRRPDRELRPAATDRPKRRWDVLWLSAIVLTAFVLRLIHILQLRASPDFDVPGMDPLLHHQWAQAFAAGETFWEGPYFRAPLYPWFLGVLHWLFGSDDFLAPRIVQAVIGSLSCGLLYLIGRQVFSRTVGVLAGFAAATYWIFMYFDAELLIPVLIVFLDLVLLWLLLRIGDRRRPILWGICGLVLGLSAVARPNILLFGPALVAWIFVLHRLHWRRALGYSLSLFVGCILPILPITIRNYVVSREFVLIATQGGVNFFIGNNPHSDGVSAIIEGDPPQWWPCYEAQIKRAEQAMGRPLKASEVSRWYFRQALRFWWRQPAAAARLTLMKLGYFWSHWEPSNNQDIRFVATYYTTIEHYLPLGFWIVGPLGALGLIISLRRARELFPLWGFVLIYMATVVLFFVTARYRVPVAFVLVLLGSHAVCWCAQALRTRRWRSLGLAAVVLLAMSLVVARTPRGTEAMFVQGHEQKGMSLVAAGRFAEGEQILDELIRRAPAVRHRINAEIWFSLGRAKYELEKLGEAVQCFERALELRPYYPDARSQLALTLIRLNRLEDAAAQFERLAQDDPQAGEPRANLAITLAQLGRVDEAVGQILAALELDARYAESLIEVARVLRLRGHAGDALRLLRTGVQRLPDDTHLLAALIQHLANSTDPARRAEAVRLGNQSCERTQGQDALLLHATALAHFSTGQTERAVAIQRRALDVAMRKGQTDLIGQIRSALRRYEAAHRRSSGSDNP